ncbi:MAG: chalcone isomerase family protein [Hydrogenophaga sp.]|nr:chalcone isomerase family protein [Hydrogenophaga sp.]
MTMNARLTRFVCMLALMAVHWPAMAAFPSTITVGDTQLQLNGQGIRHRVVFKVYEMALYTQRPVSSAQELIGTPGPTRLSFVALRELPGTDLGLAFIKGMAANSPREAVQRHVASTARLVEVFSGKQRLMPGDHFAMEYLPGKGTLFYIQDVPQGAPVGDAEFFAMVLRIWMGPAPADQQLKNALLGGK